MSPRTKLVGLIALVWALALPRVVEGLPTRLEPITSDVTFARTHGSGDIEISRLQTCGCWSGPRGQAQKKFKFRIVNHSRYRINIGGGKDSNLRLLVAFPRASDPTTSLPEVTGDAFASSAAMPAGVSLTQAVASEEFHPPELKGANQIFGVDDGWQVVMYPPNPNAVIEDLYGGADSGVATFPTYVEDEWLDPGETAWDPDYGEGSWVFYIPVTKELFDLVVPPEDQVPLDTPTDGMSVLSAGFDTIRRATYSKAINILGIAVINPASGGLLGFAPAPTDSMYSSPEDF